MAIFPVPPFRETLKKKNHVYTTVVGDNVSSLTLLLVPRLIRVFLQGNERKVGVHMIPNLGLGTVDRRHLVRICFPRLYSTTRTPALSQPQIAAFIDKCLLPTVAALLPNHVAHLPVDYRAAFLNAYDRRGQLHFPSRDLPAACLEDFATELLERMETIPEFRQAFFLHELRGTKSAHPHSPSSPQERDEALQDLMSCVHPGVIDVEDWLIDVGLEIRVPNKIVHWCSFRHGQILSWLLPNASEAQIARAMRSPSFLVDRAAQLDDLAGFRFEPGQSGRRDEVAYINVYSTDKEVHYQLHEGIWRQRTPQDLFPDKIKALLKDIAALSEVFIRAMGSEEGASPQEGSARVEIRVPLRLATRVLIELPTNIRTSMRAFSSNLWW
ncbi:hypothetical protein DENSPDRAFT_789502 [Dentipellis sp. KUC8613]|nr:hypothetical protein DENSPDRAFT_789502 [Dentipellis sp. KUC8613]